MQDGINSPKELMETFGIIESVLGSVEGLQIQFRVVKQRDTSGSLSSANIILSPKMSKLVVQAVKRRMSQNV